MSNPINWGRVLENFIPAALVAVLLAFAAWMAGYGELRADVANLKTGQNKQIMPAVMQIPTLRDDISEIKDKRLPQLERNSVTTGKIMSDLRTGVRDVRRKLNDEVIPWINRVKEEGPPIQPAQLEPLYEQQRQLGAEVAQSQEVNEQRADAVRENIDELRAYIWRANGKALKAELEQTVKNAVKPIISEWEQAVEFQSSGTRIPNGFGFIPSGAKLSTRPQVRVLVEDGIVRIVGVVPGETARASIIDAAEKFRPKPLKVETEELRIQP